MRFASYAAAAIAATVMVPATASAAITVQIDAFATGTITDFYRNAPNVVTASSRQFTFDLGSDLDIGQSQSFTFGPNSNAGVAVGTITRIADDRYGNQAFAGSNFVYGRFIQPDSVGHAQETILRAASFTVRQIVPAPVPEPMTWMTMVLGFGVIGYAMRRRAVTFARNSLV